MAFPGTPARKLLPLPDGFTGGALSFDLDGAGAGDFFRGLWQLATAKAAELLAYLAALLAALEEKADEFFPPETRSSETLRQWLHVAVTVLVPVVLAALLLHCCRCACRGGGRRRFMAAPGRGGARMPRGVFENNPRTYFRDLRAGKPLVI